MQEEQKKRKRRTSVPSELEVENRKIGRIIYFFGGVSARLKSPEADILNMMTDRDRAWIRAASNIIEEVKRDVLERQAKLVAKLKEERDAAKLSNNN